LKSDSNNLHNEYPEELIKSGVRGKYSRRFREGVNVVLIAPDLHEIFPDSKSVDKALRAYLSQTS
jgi:hypothetical protein